MSFSSIGTLERVAIRELWRHEEHGFSRWLFENGDLLSEVLGFSIEMIEREKWVGSFKVDLVAESEGALVIIENQLEPTNHDHLGKLLTYASNLEAKAAVWVVTSARAEHVRAINWLNEYTPADVAFFLVKLEAFRIGGSAPAPLLTLVVGPSKDTKAIGEEKKELAERHVLRLRFWKQLLDVAKNKGLQLHANRAPTKDNWISAGAGRSGFSWTYLIWMSDSAATEFYVDTGDKAKNEGIFDLLLQHKDEIESSFGEPLLWERLDEKRGCRVRYLLRSGGLTVPEDQWPAIQVSMVDAMARLSRSIQPHLQKIG